MEEYRNTKENNKHYRGRIWVTKNPTFGSNICADIGRDTLMVIGFVPKITEEKVKNAIEAMGWAPEAWM